MACLKRQNRYIILYTPKYIGKKKLSSLINWSIVQIPQTLSSSIFGCNFLDQNGPYVFYGHLRVGIYPIYFCTIGSANRLYIVFHGAADD